jgi:hypothetical protein
MTDTLQQAADAVLKDATDAAAAEATSGTAAATLLVAADAAHIVDEAVIAGTGVVAAASTEIEAELPAAETLWEKIKADLAGIVEWPLHEWEYLEAAVKRHL